MPSLIKPQPHSQILLSNLMGLALAAALLSHPAAGIWF